MSQATWEKPANTLSPAKTSNKFNWKFMFGGFAIIGAVIYLISTGTVFGARYYITVDELMANPAQYQGQTIRIAGVVLGPTIEYDSENLIIDFVIANVPEGYDDLAEALFIAANNPDATRLAIHIENQVRPELLQHEAQAILSGTLGEDGVFYATEILLKCPTRFTGGPDQAIAAPVES